MFGMLAALYRPIYDLFGQNEFNITIWGTFILTFGTTITWSLFFSIVDLYQWPKFMLKYKVQPGTNTPVDKAKLFRAYRGALFNLIVVNLSVAVLIFPLQRYFGCTSDPDKMPYIWTWIMNMVVIVIINDIGFYYSHRLLHWGPLYKAFHKQHHEWTSPTGIVANYAHPVEHLLSQSIPYELGPMLCGAHLCTMWFWAVWGMTVTVVHHSGYHLPFFDSPEFHDFHHLKFNVNYGGMHYLDHWHGTDYQFEGTVEEKRHLAFYSRTKSIRDLIPDPIEKKTK